MVLPLLCVECKIFLRHRHKKAHTALTICHKLFCTKAALVDPCVVDGVVVCSSSGVRRIFIGCADRSSDLTLTNEVSKRTSNLAVYLPCIPYQRLSFSAEEKKKERKKESHSASFSSPSHRILIKTRNSSLAFYENLLPAGFRSRIPTVPMPKCLHH